MHMAPRRRRQTNYSTLRVFSGQRRAWKLAPTWRIKEGCSSDFYRTESDTGLSASEEPMSSITSLHTKGLEGVVATTSSICYIDGDQGVLAYRGFDIHDLAEHSTFEEVCHLLWFGRLPNASELKSL